MQEVVTQAYRLDCSTRMVLIINNNTHSNLGRLVDVMFSNVDISCNCYMQVLNFFGKQTTTSYQLKKKKHN